MNSIIEQAKKDGTFGVLQSAYGAYVNDRDSGRSHDKAFKSIARSFYITQEEFDAMIEEFGAYEEA